MRFNQFYTKLFCTPLMLDSRARLGMEKLFISAMRGEVNPKKWAVKMDPKTQERRANGIVEMRGSDTALIHIDGALDKNLSALDMMCMDATDVNDIQRAISTIKGDSTIKNVMPIFNTPGGSVAGIPETFSAIKSLCQSKNVFAFVDSQCCSAGMYIASACDQIFITPSADAGSIGVYLALLDESRSLEQEGIKIETIKDGTLKAAGAWWKPLTDEERAHFQAQVNYIGAGFRAAVNEKRPQVQNEDMQGQSFIGQQCVDNGMCDLVVSSLEEALAQF